MSRLLDTNLVQALLPELLTAVIRLLDLPGLYRMAAVCHGWHALLVEHLCSLRLAPELLQLVAPETSRGRRARLSALRQERALVAVGGYNSGWNNHAPIRMEADGPGCERSAEVICAFRGAEAPPWCQLPPMMTRRADMALVAAPGSTLYALGGREGAVTHATVERLDLPRWQLLGEGWAAAPPMSVPRSGPVAACVGGHVFVAGGRQGDGAVTPSVQGLLYAAGHDDLDWTELAPMHAPRDYAASALLEESWYVLGGLDGHHRVTRRAERYDAGSNSWLQLPPMGGRRHWAAAVAQGGRVLVIGGSPHHAHLLPTVESFDPREGRWQLVVPPALGDPGGQPLAMHCGRGWWGGGAAANGEMLYVYGGSKRPSPQEAGRSLDAVWIYDLRRSQPLSGASSLQVPRWCGGAAVVDMAC